MVSKLTFTDEETAWFEKITKYYVACKELLIFGEQIDPENRTLVQSINELRNCLDHLIRVISSKLAPHKTDDDPDYIRTNLDKAYGHVYRAAYDTLDWVSLTLKDRIVDELRGFSLETIQAVLPEYFTKIKPRVEQIQAGEITRLRMEKDVARKSEENLVKYGQVTAELKQLYQTISNRKSALVEHQSHLKQSRRKKLIQRIAVDVAIGITVGILVWLLT